MLVFLKGFASLAHLLAVKPSPRRLLVSMSQPFFVSTKTSTRSLGVRFSAPSKMKRGAFLKKQEQNEQSKEMRGLV